MKIINFFSLAIVLFAASFAASAQSQCDLDSWAQENAGYYSDQPRAEFVKLTYAKQQALYNLYSPEQKAALWQYKMKDIMKSPLLSKSEKKELKRLYKFAQPQYFDPDNTAAKKELDTVVNAFKETMGQQHGWTEKEFFTYCECLLTENEIREYCKINNLSENDFLRAE